MKKLVVKLNLNGDRDKQKVLETVTCVAVMDSISVNLEENKVTVIGNVDPVEVVTKLRKKWETASIFTFGPAKEEEKKETIKPPVPTQVHHHITNDGYSPYCCVSADHNYYYAPCYCRSSLWS